MATIIKGLEKVDKNCIMYDANGEKGLAYLNKEKSCYESGNRPIKISENLVETTLINQKKSEEREL